MSSNVGLSTPRGSGTSGYVQRNLSLLKPRDTGYGQPYTLSAPKQRKPDQQILKHDREREVEVKVLELRDKLEDDGKLDDDEIDEQCEQLRKRLIEDGEKKGSESNGRRMKGYQVHEMAEAKEKESERLRRALGLKEKDVNGDENEHPMAKQDRRRRERELEIMNREERQDRLEREERDER